MQLFINNWSSRLASPLASTSLSMLVPIEDAAALVGLGSGAHYLLTLVAIDEAGAKRAHEIVRVTAAVGGSLTIARAQEDTTPSEWPISTMIEARYTAGAAAAPAAALAAHAQTDDAHPQYMTQAAADARYLQGAELAPVATSGSYGDLTGRPFIPASPGDVGAASAAQGALAETAVQPAALSAGLADKVDKLTGYGLSQESFTTAEKAKLAGLESSSYKGTYTNLTALMAAHPSAEPGAYADVDAGVSDPVLRYIWDASDSLWVAQAGSADPVTAAQVKTLYESNPDTNAFTDSEKAKLAGVASGATANADTDSLTEGSNNLYHTAARVRDTVLTGLSLADSAVVVATDSVLQSFGKLSARLALAFDRANHTGTQAISTVTGLQTALDGKARVAVVVTVTASRSLAMSDVGEYLSSTSASAIELTMDSQATVAWPENAEIHFEQAGAGAVTIVAGAGVTINRLSTSTATIAGQYGVVTLKRTAENVWTLFGALEAA